MWFNNNILCNQDNSKHLFELNLFNIEGRFRHVKKFKETEKGSLWYLYTSLHILYSYIKISNHYINRMGYILIAYVIIFYLF